MSRSNAAKSAVKNRYWLERQYLPSRTRDYADVNSSITGAAAVTMLSDFRREEFFCHSRHRAAC